MKVSKIVSLFVLLAAAIGMNAATYAADRTKGRGTGPVIYVASQGLFYDSIVVADPIPQKGRFQQLTMEW